MTKLVFASSNKNKLKEISSRLPERYELVSLSDLAITEDIPETADSFQGNAYLKASYIVENYQLDCFADDSGLEVNALNGAPGVYSARYAGAQRSDEANIEKLLDVLKDSTDRSASFKTVICLHLMNKYYYFEGIVEGDIIREKRGENGFGYDPIFIPKGENRTFAEMTMEEKNQFSHRARALDKMMAFLAK